MAMYGGSGDSSPVVCRSPSSALEYKVSVNSSSSPDRRTVNFEDVLDSIGFHKKQVYIIIMCCLLYSHGTIGTLTLTLATPSMLEYWPELKERPLYYNTQFALTNVARLVGSVLLLPLMDRIGRRTFTSICFFVSFILAPISGFAPNFVVWMLFRCVMALLATNLTAAAMVYNFELVSCTRRALPAILTQTSGCFFIVYASFLNGALEDKFGDASWRYLAWIVPVPQIITAFLFFYTWLETPRFDAVVKGNTSRAWRTLVWLSPGGELNLRDRLEIPNDDAEISDHLILLGDRNEVEDYEETSFWSDIRDSLFNQYLLASRKETRGKMFWICMVWFLQSFSHWGIVTYMSLFYKDIGLNVTYTTAGSFLVQLPSQVILYFLMQWRHAGRVRSMQIYFFLCTIAHGVLAVLVYLNVEDKTGMTIAALMCFFFGGPIWGPLYAYTTEIFPTVQRSAGVGLASAVAAIANIGTTYAGTLAVTSNKSWSYPLIWGSLRLAACACCFMLKYDTRDMPLDDGAVVSRSVSASPDPSTSLNLVTKGGRF